MTGKRSKGMTRKKWGKAQRRKKGEDKDERKERGIKAKKVPSGERKLG